MKLPPLRFVNKYKLPEQYHRTKKIMLKDREKIKLLYNTGEHTYRSLSKLYNVSYGVIQVIINNNTYLKNLVNARRYRNKPDFKRAKQTMELRYRKIELIKEGIIKLINK